MPIYENQGSKHLNNWGLLNTWLGSGWVSSKVHSSTVLLLVFSQKVISRRSRLQSKHKHLPDSQRLALTLHGPVSEQVQHADTCQHPRAHINFPLYLDHHTHLVLPGCPMCYTTRKLVGRPRPQLSFTQASRLCFGTWPSEKD